MTLINVLFMPDQLARLNWKDSLMEGEFCTAAQLEEWTGTKASTWRYWVLTGTGPKSFKIGRRRVWRRADVMAWIKAQEAATGTGGA
jgi:prophage regulatory protein